MHRNSIAREIATEARRAPRLPKLEKKNRENAVASAAMRGVLSEAMICGVKVFNVRFTDKGLGVDLEDGSTVVCRITAYAPDEK